MSLSNTPAYVHHLVIATIKGDQFRSASTQKKRPWWKRDLDPTAETMVPRRQSRKEVHETVTEMYAGTMLPLQILSVFIWILPAAAAAVTGQTSS